MGKLIKLLIVFSVLIYSRCEKINNVESNEIKIKTGKTSYIINDKIDLILINNTNSQAKYFICDNSDLDPTWILKYDNGNWIDSYYPLVCTAWGPAGFYGTLNVSEIKLDTITLFNEIGKFKLRFRFVIGNDSIDFDSNEFIINGLDL